jgi:DNA-binding HxlR family transcriptional regulator
MAKHQHNSSCPIGNTLGIIAGRWKPEILWHLKDETMRFNQLQRAIGGVSQKMLTQQLRELQRDGLVILTQFEEIPPRVEYCLTGLADSLKPLFGSIVAWSDEHANEIQLARTKYDLKLLGRGEPFQQRSPQK